MSPLSVVAENQRGEKAGRTGGIFAVKGKKTYIVVPLDVKIGIKKKDCRHVLYNIIVEEVL